MFRRALSWSKEIPFCRTARITDLFTAGWRKSVTSPNMCFGGAGRRKSSSRFHCSSSTAWSHAGGSALVLKMPDKCEAMMSHDCSGVPMPLKAVLMLLPRMRLIT